MLQSFRRNEAILAEKLAIMFWTNILAILSLPLKIILSVSHNFKICWVAINIRVTATSEPSLSFPFLLPTMRAISEHTKNNIISALHQGLSTRKVAERCGVSDFTVRKVRKECTPNLKLPSPGRPTSLSPQSKRLCVRAVTSGKLKTAKEAAKHLEKSLRVKVSEHAVRWALKEAGLEAAKKVSKPRLSPQQVSARLEFAKCHKDWTNADWARVIFSDETRINRFCSDGLTWCWKRDGTSLQSHQVQEKVKHGGGSIMIWGCMTADGVGFMCKIEGTLNGDLYLDILKDELQRTIKYYGLDRSKVIFQQDNASCHKTAEVRRWLDSKSFKVLEWPAQSPDLNPLETLWAIVKRRLNEFETPPSGMLELWERIEQIWNEVSPETCRELIKSMPKRIEAVLRAKGRWTNF
jgi:transposase